MTAQDMFVGVVKLALYGFALAIVLALVGCQSADPLAHVDAGCINISVDGYFTDSGAQGRAIKLPEGEALTTETIEALCP